MVGLLFAGFILWLSSPLIMEFLEHINENVFSPVGEWIRNLLGLEPDRPESAKSFVVSEYLARIEKASLDILESRKPADKIIVLWWGLDGLRLNEDGALEWISREKSKQTKQTVSVQFTPPGSFRTGMLRNPWLDQTQSTRAQIDALMAQNAALQTQNAIQQCCVQYPAQYPPYYYGGCCRIN